MNTTCLACGGTALSPLLEVTRAPAMVGALMSTEDLARHTLMGQIQLAICEDCSHVGNVAFDGKLVEYDSSYENSLHFSPTFQRYADALADRLIKTSDLQGKTALEIGSGKGEFLSLLHEKGVGLCVGYDPSYAGESDTPGVRFERSMYPFDGSGEAFDFLVCRHVLEHLAEPVELLLALRRQCADSAARLYFEVPNGEFTMSAHGHWDLIYPHVSYFTMPSLRRLMVNAGFEVRESGACFDGQFLYVEAAPSAAGAGAAGSDAAGAGAAGSDAAGADGGAADRLAVAAVIDRVKSFASSYEARVAAWRQAFALGESGGAHAALWGAGAKGATFLNAIGRDSGVAAVIDANPRKWGRYVPGTGHVVSSPETLVGQALDTVVVTNSSYKEEIVGWLARLGVSADVTCV